MTDKDGQVLAFTEYDAWGKMETQKPSTMNFAGLDDITDYTGHTYDEVLEKYFAQARFYDAVNRRFVAEDPVKDGLNWYAYVSNNPTNYVDPNGLALVQLKKWLEDRKTNNPKLNIQFHIAYNDQLKEAIVTMSNNFKKSVSDKFRVGIDGTYINPYEKRMYVEESILWRIFGSVIDLPLDYHPVRDAAVIAVVITGGVAVANASGASTAIGSGVTAAWDGAVNVACRASTAVQTAIGWGVAKIGDQIGNFGRLINNPGTKVDWSKATGHVFNRMAQKGVTQDMFEAWVATGKAIQQDANTIMYVTKAGVAIMKIDGVPITAYTSEYFKQAVIDMITQLFGK